MPTNTPFPAHFREETRFDMEQSKIDRINFLARKQKSEGLTEEERREQALLRKEYVNAFKASLVGQLENLTIVEPDGTKHKVKKKYEDTCN